MKIFFKVLGAYTAIILLILAGSSLHQKSLNSAPIEPIIIPQPSSQPVSKPAVQTTKLASVTSSGAKATNKSPSANACTPAASAPAPKLPALSVDLPGVHQPQTVTTNYNVYGSITTQVNNQLFTCSPVAIGGERFAASTDYALGWTFDYTSTDGQICATKNVSVGLAISQVYPVWQGNSANVKTAWDGFIINLTTHENGHVNIDETYAQTIFNDLKNLPATDCGLIVNAANAAANADVKALDQANTAYDNLTQHGATQGAVLR